MRCVSTNIIEKMCFPQAIPVSKHLYSEQTNKKDLECLHLVYLCSMNFWSANVFLTSKSHIAFIPIIYM